MAPPSWKLDDETLDSNFISYDDLLRDLRDYTVVLDFISNIPVFHKNPSGVSADPQVQGLVDQIRDLTRRDLFTPAAPSPEAVSPVEPLLGAKRGAFVRGSITDKWKGSVARNRGTFAGLLAGYSENGDRFLQQQNSA